MRLTTEIIKSKEISKEEFPSLSRLQRFICRLFKIKPLITYTFTYEIETSEKIPLGSVIILLDGTKWLVIHKNKIKSMEPYVSVNVRGTVGLLFQAYFEGTKHV